MSNLPPTIDTDAEVLPPDGRGKAPTGRNADNSSDVSRIIAHWMDEFFYIPGTNFKIGLDPLIGLFPFVGDILASSVGLVVVTEGVRNRVPVFVLVQMGLNVLINDLAGSIPVVGDIFSAWFKSNSRNLALLNRWKSGDREAVKRSSRVFLAAFIVVWLCMLVGSLFVWLTIAGLIVTAWKTLMGV